MTTYIPKNKITGETGPDFIYLTTASMWVAMTDNPKDWDVELDSHEQLDCQATWRTMPHLAKVADPAQLSSETRRECGLDEEELSEEDQMREAYEITDPKHPDYIDHCQWILDTMEDR